MTQDPTAVLDDAAREALERVLALLAEEGCTLYQGFLCAPPLSGEALAERLQS